MTDQLTITCPHCNEAISLDEALSHQLAGKYKDKYEKEALEKAQKTTQERFELELKSSRDELDAAKKRNQELIEQLTQLNKLMRDLKQKDEERGLQMEKQLLEKEEKIRADAEKKAQEEQHLKLLEKDKQLQNALKEADELKRKLQQGSQQNQGEVLELELEQLLAREFPNDKISPVAKGIRGADVVQEVWDRTGIRCGTLLWESKNAKWNENWIDKLKEDQRQIKAELAVLISEHVPDDIKTAAYRNGVWVAQRTFAIGIGMALRANLIQASFIKRSMQGKDEKKEILWNYLTSTEFTQRMEVLVEAFKNMQEDLDQEKRAYTKLWAKREMQMKRISENTFGLRGDLEGVMGNALPPIKQLELETDTTTK